MMAFILMIWGKDWGKDFGALLLINHVSTSSYIHRRVDDVISDTTSIVALERQMDRCLIQLQTLASVVSIALRRTEYL